jgi:hypothetical protein
LCADADEREHGLCRRPSITNKVKAAISANAALKVFEIQVFTEKHVVQLSGSSIRHR